MWLAFNMPNPSVLQNFQKDSMLMVFIRGQPLNIAVRGDHHEIKRCFNCLLWYAVNIIDFFCHEDIKAQDRPGCSSNLSAVVPLWPNYSHNLFYNICRMIWKIAQHVWCTSWIGMPVVKYFKINIFSWGQASVMRLYSLFLKSNRQSFRWPMLISVVMIRRTDFIKFFAMSGVWHFACQTIVCNRSLIK